MSNWPFLTDNLLIVIAQFLLRVHTVLDLWTLCDTAPFTFLGGRM